MIQFLPVVVALDFIQAAFPPETEWTSIMKSMTGKGTAGGMTMATATWSLWRFLNNPVKFAYFKKIMDRRLLTHPHDRRVLDVGCGGGYLSEELAKAGLRVTGIDLSRRSIDSAKKHAEKQNLEIDYFPGSAEDLPFAPESFDFVCCCDVLEHVHDTGRVIAEISRVLKTDGLFFYDTINRTLFSRLVMIKILQDWKSTALLGENVHVWKMFIKPTELVDVLGRNNLRNIEIKGLGPSWNLFAHYLNLRRRARGKLSWPELSRRMHLGLTADTRLTYLGHALRV